jgi:hypothetical protein
MNRFALALVAALGTAGALVASAGESAARAPIDPDGPLVVRSTSPARDQPVLPDLSDPGLNNRITVRLSAFPVRRDVVDESGDLSAKCRLLGPDLEEIRPLAADLRRNVLVIEPLGTQRPVLAQGRYTLVLDSSIRSTAGRRLNDGRAEHRLTFSVGVAPPVLRRVAPRAGRTDVAPRRPLVASFDLAMLPASLEGAVRVEDRSTDPATPVPVRTRLARRGRDLVVQAESRDGFPAGADLALVLAGQGTATDPQAPALRSLRGAAFVFDGGLHWRPDLDVPDLAHSNLGDFDLARGEFTMTFRTRGR